MALHTPKAKSAKVQIKGLVCRPLDTFADITWFLNQPPAWRTLCKELTPHSKTKLKNMEIIHRNRTDIHLEAPETFCHYDPDAEDVLRYDENTLPKTLVCHDMANGYHDDSFIEGTTNHSSYTFYNWAAIDIFCYFSHHFITIPPLSWINIAHDHGVKVIGTIITEWNEGTVMWNNILSSEAEASNFASTLVTIASTLKFDGWLLNVENKKLTRRKLQATASIIIVLDDPLSIIEAQAKQSLFYGYLMNILTMVSSPDKLLKFVSTLHGMLHKELPHAVLIWYDSVTVKGNLNWQNRLNEKNKAYFDVCDGIFTNYSWDEGDLEASAETAGDRLLDLFIGVDIWGRNFYGGGHLNAQEAVAMVHQHGCSMALFAPAWTHEALSTDPLDINGVSMTDGYDKCDLFYLRDRALWGSLWPFLSTRAPCQLPFKTSFCRGMGRQRRMYGEVLCNAPWYNLRHQQYQPNSAHGPHGYLITSFEIILKRAHEYKERQKGILRYRDSFQSGSCLRKKESEQDHHVVEWIVDEEGPSVDTKSLNDEQRNHGLPSSTADHKHVHVKSEDVKKPSEGSSGSDEDEKKKNLRSSSSGSTLLQSVKKVLMKIRHHKSLSELTQAGPASSTQSPNQSHNSNTPAQRSHESLAPRANASKTSADQSAPPVQVDNKDQDVDQPKARFFFNDDFQSYHEEIAGSYRNYYDSDDDEEDMEAGSSMPLVARTPDGKSMQQMSVKIRLGSIQRRAYGLSRVPGELECLEFWLEDSFNGGACLRIHPSDDSSPVHRHSRLFHCDFLCEPAMMVCVVTKTQASTTQSLNILLKMKNVNSESLTVVLIGRNLPQGKEQHPAARGQLSVPPLNEASFPAQRAALLVEHPAYYVPVHNDFGWKVWYYKLSLPGCRITSVCCHALQNTGSILLGHFAIVPLQMV